MLLLNTWQKYLSTRSGWEAGRRKTFFLWRYYFKIRKHWNEENSVWGKKKKAIQIVFSYIISQLFYRVKHGTKILLLHFRRWNILDSRSDLTSLLCLPGPHVPSSSAPAALLLALHTFDSPAPDSTTSLLSRCVAYSEYLTI